MCSFEKDYVYLCYKKDLFSYKKILFIHCMFICGILISISWNIKGSFIFQSNDCIFVFKIFVLYICKGLYFVFSVLIKSDFRLIWVINSFSSTVLNHLSDEWKEPISTIWSTSRELYAVRSLVGLIAPSCATYIILEVKIEDQVFSFFPGLSENNMKHVN